MKCSRSLARSFSERPAGVELLRPLEEILLKYCDGRGPRGFIADVPKVEGGNIEVCGILGEGPGGA